MPPVPDDEEEEEDVDVLEDPLLVDDDDGEVVVWVEVVVGVELVVVTPGVVLVLVVGWHEAVTFWTGPTPAGTSCDGGVPGAASTMNVSVCPLSSVTVTVHWSAEAVGSAAIALTASTDAKVVAPIFSLRLLDTLS